MGFLGGLFGAVSLRLMATSRSEQLLDKMQIAQVTDHRAFLLDLPASDSLYPEQKDNNWAKFFYFLIWNEVFGEYFEKKNKVLNDVDAVVVKQAVGYALSQRYPDNDDVQQFISTLPVGV